MPQHQRDPDPLLDITDGEGSAPGSRRYLRRRPAPDRRRATRSHGSAVRYHHYLNVAYLAPSAEGDDEYDETAGSATDHYTEFYGNQSGSCFDQLFVADTGHVRQEWDAFTETTEEQQRHMLRQLSSSSAHPAKEPRKRTRHDTDRHRDFLMRIDRRLRQHLKRGADRSFLVDMEEAILLAFFPHLVKSSEQPLHHIRVAVADSFHRLTFHALCQYYGLRSKSSDADDGSRVTTARVPERGLPPHPRVRLGSLLGRLKDEKLGLNRDRGLTVEY